MGVNTLIFCCVLYFILLLSQTECQKNGNLWKVIDTETDRLMFLTGLVGFLCKVSPEIMDPIHAVKVNIVLIRQ